MGKFTELSLDTSQWKTPSYYSDLSNSQQLLKNYSL